MAQKGKRGIDICLALAIVFTLTSIIYWSISSVSNYAHFIDDAREYATSFYYDVAYPNVAHGLQFLVFGNHLSPDQVLIVPFYYLFQSPVTLLIVQSIVFSLTGLIVFFAARYYLKSGGLGLVLCIAFLISPLSQQVISAWYYLEYLIAPFAILSFYYFMKLDKKMFYISTILLLGTIEIAPLITGFLALGLIAHERLHEKNPKIRNERIKLALGMIALAVAALVLYNIMFYSLTSSYQTSYQNLPPVLKVLPFPTVPLAAGIVKTSNYTDGFITTTNSSILISRAQTNIVSTITSPFLAFGIAAIFNPIVTIVTTFPWMLGFSLSTTVSSNQFNAYFIAGSMIGTITGMGIMISMLRRFKPLKNRSVMVAFVGAATLAIVITYYLITPIFVYALLPSQFNELYLFQLNSTQQQVVGQLDSMIALLPANASVMTDSLIYTHLVDREYVEQPDSDYYFKPEYILVDPNNALFSSAQYTECLETPSCSGSSAQSYNYSNIFLKIYNGTETYPYALYARNGTAMLYKIVNNS